MMSLKRKFFEENPDGKDCKQRQRMTTYHLNNIFRMRIVHFFRFFFFDKKTNSIVETTQQKLYEGSKNFFRKLKESTVTNGKRFETL